MKGKAPVDAECQEKIAHVFYDSNDVYDVMLNQVSGVPMVLSAQRLC